MTFRLNNKDHYLSADDLANILLVQRGGDTRDHDLSATRDLWDNMVLTEFQEYNNVTNKTANIWNPVFRYIQKVLASSLFARHETRNVRLGELWIIM